MTTITPEDRDALRALASTPTPGPWRSARDQMEGYSVVESDHERIANTGSAPWSRCPVENAAYIAAANPATMTALLDALDQAEAERDKARAQVDRVRVALSNYPRACEKHPDDDVIRCGWKSAVLDVQAALDGPGV